MDINVNFIKEKILTWYNSLSSRDKKTLYFFILFLLPLFSGWLFFKELNIKTTLENKIKSMPSESFIKKQIILTEKEGLFYKQNIPKLEAQLINPNTYYSSKTPPNQIPIILNDQIKNAGGYILSLQEGIPMIKEVNDNSQTVISKKKSKSKKPNNKASKIFELELVPIKLSIAVSEANVLGFLQKLNKPNNSYPMLIINNISLGKKSCDIKNVFNDSKYFIINTYKYDINTRTPIGLCLSGYALSDIKLVKINKKVKKKVKKNAKKK